MAHPFASQPLQSQLDVQLLLALCGQLSGDGQLRELMQERRCHPRDGGGGLWYLSPARLVELRHCSCASGGQLQPISLSSAWLMGEVLELPAPAPLAPVG